MLRRLCTAAADPRRLVPSASTAEQHAGFVQRAGEGLAWLARPAEYLESEVLVVRSREGAQAVMERLSALDDKVLAETVFACDTETIDVDPTSQTPVGNGRVICASVYSPNVDFGDGKRLLFLDNYGPDAEGSLDVLAPFWSEQRFAKVWHNYGFDRHVISNHGLAVGGFHADTLHMARLLNTSRTSYSLAALTAKLPDNEGLTKVGMKTLFGSFSVKGVRQRYIDWVFEDPDRAWLLGGAKRKVRKQSLASMDVARLARMGGLDDGSNSDEDAAEDEADPLTKKRVVLPYLEEVHASQGFDRDLWVCYSSRDAIMTYKLYEHLRDGLEAEWWDLPKEGKRMGTMFDYYREYWRSFGELLTSMERRGLRVDRERLLVMKEQAEKDLVTYREGFLSWAESVYEHARALNINSRAQLGHFFFGRGTKEITVSNEVLQVKNKRGGVNKTTKIMLPGFGLGAYGKTPSGQPQLTGEFLHMLAGSPFADPPVYGDAHAKLGREGCEAIFFLAQLNLTEKLHKTYLEPLYELSEQDGRIHTRLNINTETGRLSSRSPNLQNQPTIFKDSYNIRSIFSAAPGNKLLVADYGQLELRVLASMTDCKSMQDAFATGGDFHSRTALGMYPEIREAVDAGQVDIEATSDERPGIKDKFALERQRAKQLNFSIAYGKTAVGLGRDWGVSTNEAKKTINLWYQDRPEVLQWQKRAQRSARERGRVPTMTGRMRHFPKNRFYTDQLRSARDRMAINSPIQGSAADIVVAAMVAIERDEEMAALGYQLLLQIHDEVVLEGPEENAEKALARLLAIMQAPPVPNTMTVALDVSAKIADNWAEGK